MRRSYLVLAVAPAVLLGAGCGGGGDGGTQPTRTPTTIAVSSPSTDSLFSIGETRQMSVVVRDQNNAIISSPTVAWSSTAPTLATVGASTGLVTIPVTGVGPGSAFIRATAGAVKDSVQVHVRQKFHHVSVSPSTATIAPSGTRQLSAFARDALNNNVAGMPDATWESSNTAVAGVNSSGLVTATTTTGPATITATIVSTSDGTRQGTAAITVQVPAAVFTVNATASSTFDPTPITIAPGDTVAWSFAGVTHNVTFDTQTGGAPAPPANIGNSTSTVVKRKFPTSVVSTATYPYHCTIHPGMEGEVIVQP